MHRRPFVSLSPSPPTSPSTPSPSSPSVSPLPSTTSYFATAQVVFNMSSSLESSSSAAAAEHPFAVVPSAQAVHSSATISAATSHSQYAGVHDAIRYGPKNLTHDISFNTSHPVQNRLEKWDQTRDNLKLNLQRNMYGIGAPAHILMERRIVAQNPLPTSSSSSASTAVGGINQLHLDILNGTDEGIEPRDFLPSQASGLLPDIHTVMERRLGL